MLGFDYVVLLGIKLRFGLYPALDFFIGYGLELSKQPAGDDLKELVKKLDNLERGLPTEEEGGEVKIKWK